MLVVTCSTEALSFTESASTVDRDRVFTTTTEAVSFTEAAAPVNRTLHINGTSTELIAFAENAAFVAIYKGTIDVTLPLISVIATGEAGLLNTLHETATGNSSFTGIFDFEITDTAVLGDELRTFTTQSVTDTATASDSQTFTAGPLLHETATATEAYAIVWDSNLSTGAWKRAHEEFEFSLSEELTEVANATDTIATQRLTVLHESAYAQDVLTASTTANNEIGYTAEASDSQTIGLGEAITDVANASDTQTQLVEPQQSLTDTATATDTLTDASGQYAMLVEAATASDLITYGSSTLNTVIEAVATANEVIWAPDYLAVAWVLNTETTGLSNYDNFGFNSIAEHNGVLYATSPNGVYSFTGDDDDGRKISAEVTTGFLDFDAEQTKRISDLYVGYTGGSLQCDVETYDGPQDVYNYQLEERDADAPRNNRLKVGRGLSSRYWRFSVKNVQGADFQLYDLTANVGRSNRRL